LQARRQGTTEKATFGQCTHARVLRKAPI